MRTFWWRGAPNFGDALARDIVDLLTPHRAVWARPESAELVVTGSIATMLPDGWTGTVAGIGWARPTARDLSKARVLALRGKKSRTVWGSHYPVALGDPGLLAPYLVPPVEPDIDIVVVPHWNDPRNGRLRPGATYVDVRGNPIDVIAKIRRAKRVVSSSLHGIIVADAYGIERRWETWPGVQGGGFKFYDHGTVVGRFEPGEWGRADPQRVLRAQGDLREAISSI